MVEVKIDMVEVKIDMLQEGSFRNLKNWYGGG